MGSSTYAPLRTSPHRALLPAPRCVSQAAPPWRPVIASVPQQHSNSVSGSVVQRRHHRHQIHQRQPCQPCFQQRQHTSTHLWHHRHPHQVTPPRALPCHAPRVRQPRLRRRQRTSTHYRHPRHHCQAAPLRLPVTGCTLPCQPNHHSPSGGSAAQPLLSSTMPTTHAIARTTTET